jgi:hypothetical protein
MLTPNEKYTALVAAAGYLPVTLTGEDYVELLPVKWRRITDDGVQIDNRTYNDGLLGPYRGQHSGVVAKRGRWEVHYDPYDVSQVFVRTPDGWITVPWTHLPMVAAPFADFRHARRLAGTGATETEVARVLDELLTRAEHGPDRAGAKITARTRAGQATHRPVLPEPPAPADDEQGGTEHGGAEVIPFGIFDADAEAERWV